MVYFLIIATAFLMGICADGILSGNLKELIDDTEEMETTDNTFLKQMKLRYKNCLRIGHVIKLYFSVKAYLHHPDENALFHMHEHLIFGFRKESIP